MTKQSQPEELEFPPKHVRPETQSWCRSLEHDYELQPHHKRLIVAAAEAWDRAQQARAVLDKQGLTFIDRFGSPKVRPEVLIERDSSARFAHLVKQLDLDSEPAPRGLALHRAYQRR